MRFFKLSGKANRFTCDTQTKILQMHLIRPFSHRIPESTNFEQFPKYGIQLSIFPYWAKLKDVILGLRLNNTDEIVINKFHKRKTRDKRETKNAVLICKVTLRAKQTTIVPQNSGGRHIKWINTINHHWSPYWCPDQNDISLWIIIATNKNWAHNKDGVWIASWKFRWATDTFLLMCALASFPWLRGSTKYRHAWTRVCCSGGLRFLRCKINSFMSNDPSL